MANRPTDTLFPLLSDELDLSTNGTYWILDDERTLDWSMSKGLEGETWQNATYYRGILAGVFETLESYVDIDFDYVGSYASPMEAYAAGSDHDVSIFTFDDSGWAAAMCNFPYTDREEAYYKGAAGDMYINGMGILNPYPESGPGTWTWSLFMHELGHGLGLKHPHDSGGYGRPTFIDFQVENFDSELFTMMSYNIVQDPAGAMYSPATPMFMDVLALQYLYGKNEETNVGNNTHYVEVNNQFQTIWDASGTDSVDASSSNVGWEIQLPDMQWSDLVDTTTGYACIEIEDEMTLPTTLYWLMGDIENANGSNFVDSLLGNENTNRFTGNGGDDIIDGYGNVDFAVFSGVQSNYTIVKAGEGNTATVTAQAGAEGTDTLMNIERLVFTGNNFALDTDQGELGGAVYRLYEAAFARTPDDDGLTYWLSQTDNGMSMNDVALYFTESAEFKALYGNGASTQDFVASLYENALGREADAEGMAYWTTGIESGAMSRFQVLLGFSESTENVALVGQTIGDGFAYDLV